MVAKFISNRYCATSADSENYFKLNQILVKLIYLSIFFGNYSNLFLFAIDLNRRTRADLFVKDHVDAIDYQLTLAVSKALKNQASVKTESKQADSKPPIKVHCKNDASTASNDIVLHETEETKPNKDRNKNSILNPQNRTHIHSQVPLLSNGSEIKRSKRSIVLTETCGFDRLASIYAALYMDSSIWGDKIDGSSCNFAAFIKLLLHQKSIDFKIEYARFDFLKKVLPETALAEVQKLTLLKCKTAVSGLFASMYKTNADILSSRLRKELCTSCTIERDCE